MAGMREIETERLVLRGFEESDLDAYAAMCADPEVMRYLGGKPLRRDEAWRQIALFLGHWSLRGFGLWALELRPRGTFIGRAGLWNPEGWPGIEVGWALDRAHWDRGYATEAARAAIRYGFETLGVPRLISVIHPENSASIRVAMRIGESYERSAVVQGTAAVIYGVDRTDFEGADR